MAKPTKPHLRGEQSNETEDQRGRVVETLCGHYKPDDMVATLETYEYWIVHAHLSSDVFCSTCVKSLDDYRRMASL